MSNIVIQIKHLTKIYHLYDTPVDRLKESLHPFRKKYHRDFYALDDISFEIKKGETVGIIGKNGAGKSTLLKILTGVLTPTEGQVNIYGRVLALLELGAGFSPELTGIENIYFNGALLGASRDELDQKLDSILEFADIGKFVYQPVKSYSSGMYVRLAFAIISHIETDILIVDEALAVGDAFFTQKCMRYLRNFMEKGTVLFVSHDTSAVVSLCNHAIWLDNGRSKLQGKPKEVAEEYLTALYESQQGESKNTVICTPDEKVDNFEDVQDMRQGFINTTQYRNDIELFNFNPNSTKFGKGGGNITSVQLLGEAETPLLWVIGGESVKLKITCHSNDNLFGPIIGFYIKDRLGQPLFGDNTFNFSKHTPLTIRSNQNFEAIFEFRMPILPVGEYTITVALAEGTQQEHVQHQWIHDALVLKSHSSSAVNGLVGIPMKNIRLNLL